MKALARAVIDAMAFLELSDEPAVDDDAAVQAMEMLAADLQDCSMEEKGALREVLAEYIAGSRGKRKRFYATFMADAGLDATAPSRLARGPATKADRPKSTGGTAANLKLLRRQLDFTSKSGDATVVAKLLDRSPELANLEFGDGSRPLHAAAMWGYDGVVKLLIDRGADVNARDRSGSTPLHWAATNGHRRACQLLLDAGADAAALDNQRQTPLAASEAFVPENAAKVRSVLKKHGAQLKKDPSRRQSADGKPGRKARN
jgi:hypothetical protein